jgi:hypothetical protein
MTLRFWRLVIVEIGNCDPRQTLLDRALNRTHIAFLFRRDKRKRRAGGLRTRGASDAVDVVVGHRRNVEVDDVPERGDVDATRGDVGRHEDPILPALEAA